MDTVAQLWPGGIAHLTAEPSPDAAIELLPVPNARAARMLVPDSRLATSASLRRYSSALSSRESLTRTAAAWVAQLAGPARLFGGTRLVVHGGHDSITDHLAGVLGQAVTVALTIGGERVNRKPVLHVFDATGRPLAFTKVGISPETRALVEHEAEALDTLHGRVRDIEIPGLIALTTWRGHPVTTMSALPTTIARKHDDRAPLSQMAQLSLSRGHSTMRLTRSPQWARVSESSMGELFGEELQQIESAANAVGELVIGAWHGDWTTWNMSRGRAGKLRLWDFERFEEGAVHGLDAFHYFVNSATRSMGSSDTVILRGMSAALAAVGGGRRQELIGSIYLAAICARYQESAAGDLGHLIKDRLNSCVTALRLWLDGAR